MSSLHLFHALASEQARSLLRSRDGGTAITFRPRRAEFMILSRSIGAMSDRLSAESEPYLESHMKCWICGADADTGEHRIKRSDLKSVFGDISPHHPLYLSNAHRRNMRVKGLNSKALKLNAKICAKCNNQLTSSYDYAWRDLSKYLRSKNRALKHNERIGLHKVFKGTVKRSMVCVHLYFVKLLGCHIAEHRIPIDLGPFSQALLHGTPHPLVYLAFCPPLDTERKSVGYTDMEVIKMCGRIVAASWIYHLDHFSVRVMYAELGERRQGLSDSWYPSMVTKRIRIASV